MAEIKGLNKALRNIEKNIRDATTRNQLEKSIGTLIVERIRAFARIGKSLVGTKNGKKFKKKLSESYMEQRRRAKETGQYRGVPVDSEFFRPDTRDPNLTLTGQMLRNMWFRIRNTKGGFGFEIIFQKKRKESNLTNEEVARHVNELRPFIGLDQNGLKRIKKLVTAAIRKRKKRG